MCMQSQKVLLPHVLKWHADLQKQQNQGSKEDLPVFEALGTAIILLQSHKRFTFGWVGCNTITIAVLVCKCYN